MCSWKGQRKKGDDRTYVRAHAGRYNCERCSGERRRVTRVGSRRSLWSLAAGYAFVQQAFIQSLCYLCNRECVGIPACSPRGPRETFQYAVPTRRLARMSYPPRGDERLLVQFPSKLRGSKSRIVSLKSNEINFSVAWVMQYAEVRWKIEVHSIS